MDEIHLRKALAKLRPFADNFQEGPIEQSYVNLYHSLLNDIRNETGHDFEYFIIHNYEMNRPDSGVQNCDRELFMINLIGARP